MYFPRNLVPRGHDDLAGESKAGESALLEDDDIFGVQAEVLVLLEEVFGRFNRGWGRHDVPGNLR